MAEERITETRTPDGNTHTTHTVVTDEPRRTGGSGWVLAIILLVAAIAAIVIFTQMGGAEVAKDEAITDAANQVGEAAGQVGDAAQEAGEAVGDAVNN